MENKWQFSKHYSEIPNSTQRYSKWNRKIIWDHPAEVHQDYAGQPNSLYWAWREKGFASPYAVRWPVGYTHPKECVCTITDDGQRLGYVNARKQLYVPLYQRLVRLEPQYKTLVKKLKAGINLLIIEVDGSHQESLSHYQKKYGVGDNFIEQDTILATKANLTIMLNDPKHPYGHGYCLAGALLEDTTDRWGALLEETTHR